eukprot:TRINITY_DN2025_c0_g1_i3.p2 TRINITY_DN2025_c0_g1~~TRINITY_DN2025_c0_g1_i3.p2  ORF type:complete len:203 (+),score=41.79 TRINITY_DN2025_c0_g1_i3:66-674(+)
MHRLALSLRQRVDEWSKQHGVDGLGVVHDLLGAFEAKPEDVYIPARGGVDWCLMRLPWRLAAREDKGAEDKVVVRSVSGRVRRKPPLSASARRPCSYVPVARLQEEGVLHGAPAVGGSTGAFTDRQLITLWYALAYMLQGFTLRHSCLVIDAPHALELWHAVLQADRLRAKEALYFAAACRRRALLCRDLTRIVVEFLAAPQ